MEKIVISCFDKTTKMVQPWADAGCKCYCIDTQHKSGENINGNIIKIGIDIAEYMPPKKNVIFASFFPPCTHLAVSGAAWFKGKGLYRLAESIKLFAHSIRIAEWLKVPYFIENPVSTISTYWREPNYKFDPCDYGGYLDPPGDKYLKTTCLWTGYGFKMPKMKPVFPSEGQKLHKLPPSPERSNLRSETPMGFAVAVFEANYKN